MSSLVPPHDSADVAHRTIVAPATVPGRAAIAIVRLSGPGTRDILPKLFTPKSASWDAILKERRPFLGHFRDGAGTDVDHGLILFNGAPRSYTGHDLAELHLHGSSLIVELVVELCLELGAELARPGEFTREAYLNGKMDLVQAEGVMALIEARSRASLDGAHKMLSGGLSSSLRMLHGGILDIVRWLELSIDFPEEDIPESEPEDIDEKLADLLKSLQPLLRGIRQGTLIQDGIYVTLYGSPNAGKSTLLNTICGRERALVSEIPGTTRDVVEVDLQLGPFRILLQDTAGMRSTSDAVEEMGVNRAKESASNSDVAVLVIDGSQPPPEAAKDLLSDADLLVVNKCDLPRHPMMGVWLSGLKEDVIYLSGLGGEGLPELLAAVENKLVERFDGQVEPLMVSRAQKQILFDLEGYLREARESLGIGLSYEAVAFQLNHCLTSINSVLGEDVQDAILDRIFAEFCLGK